MTQEQNERLKKILFSKPSQDEKQYEEYQNETYDQDTGFESELTDSEWDDLIRDITKL
jgi:hypothetical protein